MLLRALYALYAHCMNMDTSFRAREWKVYYVPTPMQCRYRVRENEAPLRGLHPLLRVCTVVHRLPADPPALLNSRAFHCPLGDMEQGGMEMT